MYKYANKEQTAVNDTVNKIYNIHPGVYLWKNVEDWVAQGNTIEPFETASEKLTNDVKAAERKLVAEKKSVKDGGIVVDGIQFDTDIEARIAYIEFMLKLSQNPSYTVQNWKASDGVWVVMDGILFNKLISAWEIQLSSLFTFVKSKENEIKSKTTPTDLDSIVIDYHA